MGLHEFRRLAAKMDQHMQQVLQHGQQHGDHGTVRQGEFGDRLHTRKITGRALTSRLLFDAFGHGAFSNPRMIMK